jgi:hypothetical protein
VKVRVEVRVKVRVKVRVESGSGKPWSGSDVIKK